MAYARPPTIEFLGNGTIGVRAFVNWMDSWFRSMGGEFAGDTPEAKKMRVSQIYIACPIRSEAGRFLSHLAGDILEDGEKLKAALIERFDNLEAHYIPEHIPTILSRMKQRERDVFSYFKKVLKVLQRKRTQTQD